MKLENGLAGRVVGITTDFIGTSRETGFKSVSSDAPPTATADVMSMGEPLASMGEPEAYMGNTYTT